MPYKTKNYYLSKRDFRGKIFSNPDRLNELVRLVRTNKYSALQLAKLFNCSRNSVLYTLYCHNVRLSNLGQFKRKYYSNELFFNKLNPVSAYWAGFIAADGTLIFKDKGISIGLNNKDKDHLLKFKEAIQTNSPIKEIKSNNSIRIGIYSRELFNSLVNLGIKPNKSLNISNVNIPDRLMHHFIRGVFDGDGSISGSDKSHIQLCIVGNKPFLEQIQEFLIKEFKINKTKVYPMTNCKTYRMQYTGSQIFKILEFIYRDSDDKIRLTRKYDKFLEFKQKWQSK